MNKAKVHEPQEDFQIAFDSSADWLEWLGPDHKYRLISPAVKKITGYSAQEFMDNPELALEIAHPDDRKMLSDHWQENLNKKAGEITFEYRVFHREGGVRWIDHTCHPIFRDGEFAGHFATNRDITTSKQAEQELRQSYLTIQALINAPSDIACVIDLDGTIRQINETLAKIYQTSPGDLIGRNLWDFATPEKAEFRKLILDQVVQSRKMARVDDFGESGLFDSIVQPIFDEQGQVIQAAILARDISDRIKIEQALREREAMMRTMIQNASVLLSAIDPTGIITFIEGNILDRFGFSQESFIGKNVFELSFVPDDIKMAIQNSLRGEYYSLQLQGARNSVIEIRFNPILDLSEAIIGAIAVGLDISESIRIQEELRRSKQELEDAHHDLELKIAQRTNELNLANQELQKRVQEQERFAAQSAALTRVTASINAQTELSGFLEAVCIELSRVTNYSLCGISLYEEETDSFQPASSNSGFPLMNSLPAIPRQLYEKYIKEFGPQIVIADFQQFNHEPGYEFLRNPGIRTLISIPMFDDFDFVGSLNVASIDEVRVPDQDELYFLKALADQTKTGILKARLFEQLAESHQRLQTLSAKLVEIQEQERRKLAGELHDEIGQSLTSLRLNLDIISRSLQTAMPIHDEVRDYLARANETTVRLLDRIREISLDLRPAMLDDLGLIPALLALFDTYSAQTDIQIRFKHSGVERRFSTDLETAVFRIIQEALTNVARHSGIKEVAVRLWADLEHLRLQVEDQGIGFNPRAEVRFRRSSGLSGMVERASSCGGQLEIESSLGEGVCLTAEFPFIYESEDR
jgi:PAS domain S-box-containing protein